MVVVALIVCAFLPTQTLLDEDEAAYSYLFTAEQRAEFDSLTTQQQRERYIDRFWRSLDPTSETDYNELREMFLRRVEFANLYYDVDIAKGWRTDRGKVLIFYGFPTMIRRSLMMRPPLPMRIRRFRASVWPPIPMSTTR